MTTMRGFKSASPRPRFHTHSIRRELARFPDAYPRLLFFLAGTVLPAGVLLAVFGIVSAVMLPVSLLLGWTW